MLRTSLVLFTGLALHVPAFAQPQQKLNIDQATVYLNGAELTSTARINLQKGENEVMFTNVAGNINTQSLLVNAMPGVVVEGVTFQNNYLATEVLSPKGKEIKDSIELVTEARTQINNKIQALAEQVSVLQSNRKVGGDNTGLSVAELTKLLDLVNAKMEGILNQKSKQEELLRKTDERIARLKLQLDEEQKKDFQPGGQLLVKFYAKESVTTPVSITYVVPNAGWAPVYDVMADDANSPVKLYYKANIYQNSGVKWNNVRLTLSTGNPQEGSQAPVLNPWYLSFYAPAPMYKTEALANAPTMYQSARGKGANLGGARSSADAYVVDGVQVQNSSMNQYVSVDNSGINTTFDIELPYTVPSDGKQHLVAVKRYEVPASYRYFAIPKLDKDAFLQAQITNWEDLNLLPGQSNIFYEGTYVGQGYMDVRNVKDTMSFSMGRDKKIVIRRERDKKLRSVKTVGTNLREAFAYSITIRNTRKEAVDLIVQDQMPVSNDKDIALEDQDFGGSEFEEGTGLMKWTLHLAPNEVKKLTFGYTIKYPKGKQITQ